MSISLAFAFFTNAKERKHLVEYRLISILLNCLLLDVLSTV